MREYVIAQWRETIWRNEFGKVVNRRCNCSNRIPGLDATGCRRCQVWWVDEQARSSLQPAQSRKQPTQSPPALGAEWWDGQL